MKDETLDATYLFITDSRCMQWRLLLERRTTGYTWCDSSSLSAKNSIHESEQHLNQPNHSDWEREQSAKQASDAEGKNSQMAESTVSVSEDSDAHNSDPNRSDIDSAEDVGSSGRSRLAGLKQLSFASLTNIRQKISEGRRLLAASSTRVMGSSTEGSNSDMFSVRGSVSSQGGCYKSEDDGVPEALNAKVGGTRLSLQQATTAKNIAQSTCGKGTPPQGMVLAGLFPDTAILTFHNIELEVLPQVKIQK